RDVDGIDSAIRAAKADTERPTLISIHTTIGYGSPNKAGTAKAHGSPLGTEEVALTKQALGWDPAHVFHIPDAVAEHMGAAQSRGQAAQAEWQKRLDAYAAAHPELYAHWQQCMAGQLPEGWQRSVPSWSPGDPDIATRAAAGKALGALAETVPWLFGGDADLGGSTKTVVAGGAFDGRTGAGRNIHFGVREHAMGAICNGMSYHGGIRPYAATFFVFSDYMRPSVRLAALGHLPAVYVWTHDSIGLGEDGPTHQPVEHLMALRAMPNLHVIRPADGNVAAQAWVYALGRTAGPTALVLSRQKLPVLAGTDGGNLARGAYVIADPEDGASPAAIVLATGSEVALALAARDLLSAAGVAIRVVSMPCWEAFRAQDRAYRDSVLPPSITARVAVEAGVSQGWEAWIGLSGVAVGIDRFGASAPGPVLLAEYGLTAERVAEAVRAAIAE
ncbi:MAG: transketolase C-terminal domain-containing protein, partial [Myxococcota bacterium]